MPRHDLILPDLGLGGQPIVLSLWLVRQGSEVQAGDPIAEVLADSVTIDLPSPADGLLVRKLVAENEPIIVGQRLAVIESG
jgi:pyruvate/2-oxoglutarate dehydrogenase complex dihydrolipoamide acyltransferase (E2) component